MLTNIGLFGDVGCEVLQSLLRLKILKRGMALEDEQKRPQFVITPRENHRSSNIMHLRYELIMN